MANTSTKSALADASAGVVGSLIAMLAFYPVDVIKTNLQASNSFSPNQTIDSCTSSSSSLTMAKLNWNDIQSMMQRFISVYFRGVHYKISHTISSSFAYFYMYSWIQSTHKSISRSIAMIPPDQSYNYQPRTSTRLFLAAFAAMINTCFTLPLDVLSARSQSRKGDITNDTNKKEMETNGHHPKDSTTSMQQTNTKPLQLKHLWKGLWPSLLLCSNPSIHFTVFDLIKAKVLQQKKQKQSSTSNDPRLSYMEAFLFGMLAKFVATIVTYPLIRAKVQLMVSDSDSTSTETCNNNNSTKDESTNISNPSHSQRMTMTRILVNTYQKEGIAGLYKGCNLQLLHTLLKSALLMMVRERITSTTQRLILGEQSVHVKP